MKLDHACLKKLQTLDLAPTKVTGWGLRELAAQKSLKRLNLFQAKVTGLKSLQTLNLHHLPGVTDDGLEELAGLKNLRTLHIGQTQVTNAGIDRLQKALPDLKIEP